jgi:vacuolar protein sorting-associated protein 8
MDISDDGEDIEGEGDYSTRMEELLSGDESDKEENAMNDSDSDEGFVYDGADAEKEATGYRQQLRDVLGSDHDEEEEEAEVEKSLVIVHDDEQVNSNYFVNLLTFFRSCLSLRLKYYLTIPL